MLVVASVPLFILMFRIKRTPKPVKKIVDSVSKHSFGIYLLHEIVLYYVNMIITPDMVSRPVCVVIRCIITFIFSWFVVIVLSKIPKTGGVLFNER